MFLSLSGTNKLCFKGCCNRYFGQKQRKKTKAKKKPVTEGGYGKYSIAAGLLMWTKTLTKIGITREDIVNQCRRDRLSSKTYSTYAIDHKFRERYTSLRIGTAMPDEEPRKTKKIPKDQPIKLPNKSEKKASLKKFQLATKCVLRVSKDFKFEDFETVTDSETEGETLVQREGEENDNDENIEEGNEDEKDAEKKKKRRRLKKKNEGGKNDAWYISVTICLFFCIRISFFY